MTPRIVNDKTTGRPRVLATRRLPPDVEKSLAERFDAVLSRDDRPLGPDALQRALGEVDGMICTVSDQLTAEVLSTWPCRCRIIANFGVGVDHIDLVAARAHEIVITNTPGVLTDDTADLTMALLLATLRRTGEGERELRSGRWTGWRPTHLLGRRATGLTLGIVGLGRIGRAVARRAAFGFGMKVLGWSRTRPSDTELEADGIAWCDSLDQLLIEADAVTLHVPGGDETAGLIDHRRIALMPPGGFLINTARGSVIDTEALLAALSSGHLAGAGLDVHLHEPAIDRRLLGHERAVLLPHLGSATREGRDAMGFLNIESLDAYFRGDQPPHRVT